MSLLAVVFAPTIREQTERLAYWRLWGRIGDECAAKVLAHLQAEGKLAADLDGRALGNHFADLVLGIGQRDGIEAGEVHPDEVGPEFHGDELGALAAAERRVEDALDALTGGAR